MPKKKPFFKEQTKAEIKKKNYVELAIVTDIINLQEDQYGIFPPLVPRGYESARKFMKHGPEVKPKRYHTLEQALKDGRTPVQLREQVFNNISIPYFCGYSFMPLGRDRRKRKVSLVECLEGARIFAYAHQLGAEIKVKPYDRAKRVRIDGAEVVAEVPSRTQKQPRTKLKLISVPIIDSREKYAISLNIGSDHSCPTKKFNIRYRYTDDKESSSIINICAHEIAAYLKTVEYYWNEKLNIISLQMSQFAIPSQLTVDYYLRWENNVLIRDPELKSEDKLRKPNRAEKEIGLWALVKHLGHDKTFFSRQNRDGNLADYNWFTSHS